MFSNQADPLIKQAHFKKCLVLRIIILILFMTLLLLFKLFISYLPLVRFMAHDASAYCSHHGMMTCIVASDCASSTTAQTANRLCLRTCTHHRDQGCGDHEFSHCSSPLV
jgi:hypothetical protein